jgi:hypothetical protein
MTVALTDARHRREVEDRNAALGCETCNSCGEPIDPLAWRCHGCGCCADCCHDDRDDFDAAVKAAGEDDDAVR